MNASGIWIFCKRIKFCWNSTFAFKKKPCFPLLTAERAVNLCASNWFSLKENVTEDSINRVHGINFSHFIGDKLASPGGSNSGKFWLL